MLGNNIFKKFLLLSVLSFTFSTTVTSCGDGGGGDINYGRWEINRVQVVEKGKPKMPDRKSVACLTEASILPPKEALERSGCTVTEHKISGNTARWAADCKQSRGTMTRTGEFIFSGDKLTGSETSSYPEMGIDVKIEITGKRLGDC